MDTIAEVDLLVAVTRTDRTQFSCDVSMESSYANVDDLLIEKERVFCGSVKVPICKLTAEDMLTNPRQLDPKNVARLRNIYLLEGCHRLDPQHHVPVLIDQFALDQALRKDNISRSSLKSFDEPKLLSVDRNITYLHGRHRLEAAKDFLEADDKWWVVDVYLEELSEPGRRAIREEYSNALNFSDGDIFRHLRHCSLRNEQSERAKWLSRLSESKRRDLNQLERFAEEDKEMERFRNSLDDLIPYTGLWPALKLGTFHRLLPLRCPEELTHYLRKVKATWDFILGGDKDLCLQLDSCTVQSLEGRCPCYSAEDLALAEKCVSRHEIFSSPCFDAQRDQLLQRLRRVQHLIPSIHTFLEDTKYLEPCARVMRGLLPEKFKGSIRQAFDRQHNGQRGFFEQVDDANTAAEQALDSGSEARWKSYRQLWLFAWRHFPEMTGNPPRKDPQKPKPVKISIEYSWWHAISVLASKSGYMNISNAFTDADETMARDFLRHARPPQLYHFDDTVFDLNVRRICEALKQVRPREAVTEAPEISSDRDSCGSDVSLRCGRPFEQAFHDDVARLYLRHIYKDYGDVQRKRYITSFAVKRDIFHAFFGSPSDRENHLNNVVPEVGPLSMPVFAAEQNPMQDNETSSLDDAGDGTLRCSEHRPLSFSPGPDAARLLLDATTQAHSSSLANPVLTVTEPCVVDSWSDVLRMGQSASSDILLFLTPLSPLGDGHFDVKQLRRSRNPIENKHLIEDLKIKGAGLEHFYMVHDGESGCKFINGPSVVENPYSANNIIIHAKLSEVEKLILLWDSQ